VATLSSLPGVGPAAATRIDAAVQAGLRAGMQSREAAAALRRLRVAQECKFGPWKQAIKVDRKGDAASKQQKGAHVHSPYSEPKTFPPDPKGRSLDELRRHEHAAFEQHKQQLRRNLERCMELASDGERARELSEAYTMLEGLRRPEVGLSRKQLKVVNGALLAVAEARRGSERVPLRDEATMMRRVARRHKHGLYLCEEAHSDPPPQTQV
jgi:hypothetical protein